MSTALQLCDAQQILGSLMEQTRDVTKCDYCQVTYKDSGDAEGSWMGCRFPDPDPATRHVVKTEHTGHSMCRKCMEDWNYIGDAGSCKACLLALGGTRAAIKKAGVALRPAPKNDLASAMIQKFVEAEARIDETRDQEEMERIRAQAAKRMAEVEAVRRRREEAEQEADEMRRRAAEEAKKEADEMLRRAAEEAEQEADETRRRAAEEAARVQRETQTRAEEMTRQTEEVLRQRREAADEDLRQRREAVPVRKRKAQDPEVVAARVSKAKKTREDRQAKLDDYDRLLVEHDTLVNRMEDVLTTVGETIVSLGGDWASLETSIRARLAKDHLQEVECTVVPEEEDEEEGMVGVVQID